MRIIILLITFLITTTCHANEMTYLSFHQVIEECSSCDNAEFVEGSLLFPDYKFHWLPDDFLIKNTPEFRLESSNVTNVLIEQITIADRKNNFLVSVNISDRASLLFKEYTSKNIGEKFAVKINDNILNIVTIRDVLNEPEFTFVVRKIGLDQLLEILSFIATIEVKQVGNDKSH